MEHVKAEWRSFKPPWGKMFHIHWALETSLGREPGRIVTNLLAGTEPIVIWFSLHYRKPDENTYCLQTQHMDLIELSAVGILERASGTIICTLNNQVTYCSGIKRWSMRVSIIWWGCLFVFRKLCFIYKAVGSFLFCTIKSTSNKAQFVYFMGKWKIKKWKRNTIV